MLDLGGSPCKGLGVVKDFDEAARWYMLAAAQGMFKAQTNLGFMHSTGQGVVKDNAVAMLWYKLAAEEGGRSEKDHLALLYYKGQLVPQDSVRAYMWSYIASGSEFSFSNTRAEISKLMTPQQIEEAQKLAKKCLTSNFKNCD